MSTSSAIAKCVLIVPGSIDSRSGGYEYDRRIVAALRTGGWKVDLRELDGSFPRPTAAALTEAARVLAEIPDGTLVIVDGLALGAMPDQVAVDATRLRIVALVHMPLAADAGLDAATIARFEESERRALASTLGVIVTGGSTADVMRSYGVREDRIAVVEPGTDRGPVARGSGGPVVHFVCVAAVTRGKGHDVLVEALARVANLAWHLTCAGSLDRDRDAADRLRTLIRTRGLDDRVSLVGELDVAGVADLYDQADVFVLATHHETYGMAVAEALAHGLPVIATATGAIPELVSGSKTTTTERTEGTERRGGRSEEITAGIVVPVDDVDSLSAALSRVIGDAGLRERFAANARRVRERLPSWDEAGVAMARALERFARPSLSQWLALREPYDHAARSEALTRAVLERLPKTRPVRIVDLGTGTGSNVRYVAPRLAAPQEWLLVDGDPEVLADLPSRMPALDDRVRYDTLLRNLGALDAAVIAGRDLVTASALLDLVAAEWLERLAHICRDAGASALFALTYNGRSSCVPTEPEDDRIRDLLNQHQRANDKGFGRAAGPDAIDRAEQAFTAVGYRVQREPSDWHLPESAVSLQRELVRGWADAAIEIAPEETPTITDWLARRLAHIDGGRSRIVVCHEDLAAWPRR